MLTAGLVYAIPVRVAGFPPPLAHLNGQYTIGATADALALAALTVGYPNPLASLVPTPGSWWWAGQIRLAEVKAYLDDDGAGGVNRSLPYRQADSTEKSSISYHIGMYVAQYVAWEVLTSVPLVHFDSYLRWLGLPLAGVRPDLIGIDDLGRWFVVEAKGRSGAHSETRLEAAKRQANRVPTVTTPAGQEPVGLHVAGLASFSGGRLSFSMRDPEGNSPQPPGDTEKLLEFAALPASDALDQLADPQEVVVPALPDGIQLAAVHDAVTDVWIGLPVEVPVEEDLVAVSASLWEAGEMRADRRFRRRERSLEDSTGRRWAVSPAGVILRLGPSWE